MKFSYSAVWDDAAGLARAHAPLIAALAGVFIFLPALLVGYFLPQPQPAGDIWKYLSLLGEYLSENWPWLLLEALLNALGAIAIFKLVFAPRGTTVAAAIAGAAALLPFYFVAGGLAKIIICVGLILVVPGLYAIGRLAPLGPAIVAENQRNPVEAVRRAFEISRGNGWAILGLLAVVAVAGIIVVQVVNSLLGILFEILAGQDVGALLGLIVKAATASAFAIVFLMLYAAIYRRLTGAGSAAAAAAD